MTILRVGSNNKYSQGWDQVFGKKRATKSATKTKAGSTRAGKKKKKSSR